MAGTYFHWFGDNIPATVRNGTAMYDVLIIGSGGAGMRAALEAAQNKGLKIAVMTKMVPTRSATTMAQGGINGAARVTDDKDSPEAHAFDTVKGADYLCDQDAVAYYAEKAAETLFELDYFGIAFNRQEDGRFHQRKMGGSSYARAAYSADISGHAVLHTMFEQCLKHDIDFISECQLLEIVADKGKLNGVVAIDMRSGNMLSVPAKSIIVATGGYGRAYWVRTSNPFSSTGDGIAACLNIGIPFKDPEMVQFHPTGLASNGVLMSESSRSEGAYLLNKNGERFMAKYAPKAMELGPRDLVCQSVEKEILEGRGIGEGLKAAVYLDFRHIPKERIMERLFQVYQLAKQFEGVDILEKPVPIRGTCHYSMGGIDVVDYKTCATKVPGVFAAGECSCVSIHGANRLGANSLSEVLVFGKTAGAGAAQYAKDTGYEGSKETLQAAVDRWNKKFDEATGRSSGSSVAAIRDKMAITMWNNAGIFRTEAGLQQALRDLDGLQEEYKNCFVGDTSRTCNTAFMNYVEIGNLLEISKGIVMGAIARKESRGSHSRPDFPKRDDQKFLQHTLISKEGGTFKTDYRPVVITNYKPVERKY
ncbi:8-methylmenaquinol:fumarate reductase flavoprotein subunit [Sporomusa acidovorans DSM 3132]|uniref:8-methylmenaquinol:fumarate reductase flavoprotein subunit n=1 Tax=Sporomusa acidovorans (strain ATCC 49682 / DSM 3132 / Mol) TaxID=1123286 RepID=A0ABZ3IW45_SPOA4|nr:fumarate reductase flavoprotein subunit [Sporomusa acidovorans DSM 3132]SDE21664.1 succinate dehydrogenase / fumarate reductase flavoprotein subunit [Sporomusa acidovorans]